MQIVLGCKLNITICQVKSFLHTCQPYFKEDNYRKVGWESVVGIATCYELDSPEWG
jgi:hypothetical protein